MLPRLASDSWDLPEQLGCDHMVPTVASLFLILIGVYQLIEGQNPYDCFSSYPKDVT